MRIEEDVKLDFCDVLIKPKRSVLKSRKDVSLVRTFKLKHTDGFFTCVPIIAANMTGVGTIEMARAFRDNTMLVALHKFYDDESLKLVGSPDKGLENVFFTVGNHVPDVLDFIYNRRVEAGCSFLLCLDVANGYTESFVDKVSAARERFPEAIIMAGNVITAEITEQLILAGADIVKCGIGPGAVCTTRKMTGVGYPQLSGIIECADAAHGLGGLICADGGIKVPGDVAKAFGAGADFVMMGGMFAGHDEGGGDVFGHLVKKVAFHGMSSKQAMIDNYGGVADYRAAEGKEVFVDYKGPVEVTIRETLGGLRSACTYVGASKLKELSKRTTFVRVGRQLNNKFGD
jgi:GMP reductase